MIDYKEVIKKDGTKLVFCRMDELLMASYGLKSMEEVKTRVTSSGEYITHCPFCKEEGHTKHKLYIREDLTVGHCFVCGRSYVGIVDEIKFEIKLPTRIQNFGYGRPALSVVPLTDKNWTLDKFSYEFDNDSDKGLRYLASRHKYLPNLSKILDFKYWDGNVVIPFKYKDHVFYYQVRFSGVSHSDSKIRYFMPPIQNKPPYIIEHGDFEGRPCKKLIICEGIFDAIALLILAPNYIPCAVLGSSISDYQIDFLREYNPEEILIFMDETGISKRIADKIKSVIDYCPVYIRKSDGEDPEELLKRIISISPGREINFIKGNVNNFCRSKYKQTSFNY